MDLKIPYLKVQKKDEAFKMVKSSITSETIARFNVKADLTYLEDQMKILAKGTGFDLVIDFHDDAAHVKLDLSFLLKPFKSKVLETLEKQLKRVV